MKMMIQRKYLWGLVGVTILLTMLLYPFLPEKIPIHWNYLGEIDSYGAKPWIFLSSGCMIVVVLVMELARHIDPRKENYIKFEHVFINIQMMTILIFFFVFLCSAYASFYPTQIDMNFIMSLMIGFLFIVIGNVMPKIKSNYFMGIKTPWTLQNSEVWRRTHRLAGKLWFGAGLLLMLSALLPKEYNMAAIVILSIVIAIIPYVYSYVCFKKITK